MESKWQGFFLLLDVESPANAKEPPVGRDQALLVRRLGAVDYPDLELEPTGKVHSIDPFEKWNE